MAGLDWARGFDSFEDFDGMASEGEEAITAEGRDEGWLNQVRFRLRDWLISRQHYWGTRFNHPLRQLGAVPFARLPVRL